MRLTQQELDTKLAKHKDWLENKPDGIRLDLSGVNLRWANLSEADLSRANLSEADLYVACSDQVQGLDIQVICLSKHRIVKYQDTIQIGCEKHSVKHWLDNYKEIGQKAGYSKKEIKQYGNMIRLLAHSSFN
jgi:hypothetical protein